MAGPTQSTAGVPAEAHDARVVGRYILFGEIAAGGMATVHFGRLNGPVGFSRTVAIKRLHAQFAKDPEFVTMFLDEARLAGRVRHPNVVPTLDVVATDGEIFLVMEYVQGESLARLGRAMRAHGVGLPADIVVTLLAGTLHGLHAAHQAKDEHGEALNIVHRDVSPQNILVGTDGVARVLDFGVAKAAGRLQTTREGQIKGKIAYMAPEQLTSGNVSRQTDIYASAVVLWEALTGRRLFEGENEAMVLMKAIEGRVPPPSSIVQGLSPAFDEVVARGVARRPEERWATAREMALALERCSRMASPSEVGEWVERTAADELTKRAARIAEIESVSSMQGGRQAEALIEAARNASTIDARPSSRTLEDRSSSSRQLPALVEVPIVEATQMHADIDSQLSSISVSRSGIASTRARARTRVGAAVAIAVAAFVGVMVVVVFTLQAGRHDTPATNAVTPTPPPAQPASMEPLPPPPALDPEPARPGPTATVTATPAAATQRPPAAPRPAPPTPRRPDPTPTPAAQAAAKNCDPPYTIDAAGHKKYKLECMTK